jgi:hypothetical protein
MSSQQDFVTRKGSLGSKGVKGLSKDGVVPLLKKPKRAGASEGYKKLKQPLRNSLNLTRLFFNPDNIEVAA